MPSARTAAVGVLVLLLAFLGVDAVAMALYPGGTWMDRTTVGHSFWGNFLCDLGHSVALDGRPNPAEPWGRAALWLLLLCGGAFWMAVPALFRSRGSARVVRIAGGISTVALLLLPFAEGLLHPVVLVLGALPGLGAAVLTVLALRHRSLLLVAGMLALALAVLALILYLRFYSSTLLVVPLTQRLATLVALSWLAGGAAAVLRAQEGAGAASAAGASAGSPRAT